MEVWPCRCGTRITAARVILLALLGMALSFAAGTRYGTGVGKTAS